VVGRELEVELGDDVMLDVVRDHVAELGVGLVRLERRRHRMVDLFTDTTEGATDVDA
jgi:ABC-2 type transport system ATP-binding protein